jgi:glycosyltransferase involved in cell wall biosynthesis
MRICIISSTPLPPQEGIGFYVWNLSRYLTRQGHKVQLITRRRARQSYRDVVDGITIWRPIFWPIYPFHVHLHGFFVNKLVRRLEADIDLFHLHSPLSPVISTKRPIMLTVHSAIKEDMATTTVNSFQTLLMKWQAPVSYWLEEELLAKATAVNAVSPYVASALRNRYPSSPDEIEVTWNGVDTDFFVAPPDSARDPRLVLSVGRLVPGKGVEDLLDAAKQVIKQIGPTRFVIAGDGPLRSSLERRLAQNGLGQHVELLGHLADRKQLADLYRQAALFVIPSHYEGLPTVMLEAMACGCPVIATKVGGIPQVIESGKNGVLVLPKQPTQLADAICEFLPAEARLAKMGRLGRKTIEGGYSWHAIGAHYIKQYEMLLA